MTDRDGPSLIPPAYVIVPTETVWADVDDGVARTMTRILGLCWTNDQRCTPPLTRAELADVLHRPRTTLSRHLRRLEALGWIEVEPRGRRLVIHSRVRPSPRDGRGAPVPTPDRPGHAAPPPARRSHPAAQPRPRLVQALAAVGVENPMRDQLARNAALEPAWVWAWHLWTLHPHRANLTNPPGFVVRQLVDGTPPPDEYVTLVTLTDEEYTDLRAARYAGDGALDDKLYAVYPLYLELYAEVQAVRASMA
ncbi:MAG: helix-turn-helix domain-containing protein [Anaerolineae bacterium]